MTHLLKITFSFRVVFWISEWQIRDRRHTSENEAGLMLIDFCYQQAPCFSIVYSLEEQWRSIQRENP